MSVEEGDTRKDTDFEHTVVNSIVCELAIATYSYDLHVFIKPSYQSKPHL